MLFASSATTIATIHNRTKSIDATAAAAATPAPTAPTTASV